MTSLKSFTVEQVAQHATEESFWLIIDNLVYDLTAFLPMHPGGEQILYPYGGKDATYVIYEHVSLLNVFILTRCCS